MVPLPKLVVGLLVLGVVSAPAQETAPTPRVLPGVERVEVRLAQFDVLVRDRQGRFVSGLGPSDFKALDDGTPMEIVAVDEWGRQPTTHAISQPTVRTMSSAPGERPAAPAAAESTAATELASTATAPERRSVVLVFDGLGECTALRMNQAKNAAKAFVSTRFRDGDIGAVYQLGLSLRPMTGVTTRPNDLVRGIDGIPWMPATSLADQINESVLAYTFQSNAAVQEGRLVNQSANVNSQLDWQREHVYDRLRDLVGVFEGLPGKRVLVLVSPGFPMTTSADPKQGTGGFTPKFQRLIKSLATYGVTVYTLDIGNDLSMGDAGEAIDWRVAVGKLGMDENTLSDLGLERTLGTNSASKRREFLGVIAAETGGRMLTDTDLTRSFAVLDEESTHFYRLSCRVAAIHDVDRYRRFNVTVLREGTTVHARRGRYSDVIPLDREASSTAVASVESIDRYRPLALRGVATTLPSGAATKIPVVIVLQAIGPIDIPAGPQGGGNLDLEIRIVARAADEVVARYERSITAKLPRGKLDPVRRAFRVEGRLDLVPGLYEVQGTLRLGPTAQLGTWSASLAVPPQIRDGTPSILGPLLSSDGDAESPLLSRPPSPDTDDPLTIKPDLRVLPTPIAGFRPGEPITLLFWLKGFGQPESGTPDLDVGVRVVDAAGREVAADTDLVYFAADPSGGYRAIARVDSRSLDAGSYNVRVEAHERNAARSVRRSVPFNVQTAEPAPTPRGATPPTSPSAL